jgi:hypothetical protein
MRRPKKAAAPAPIAKSQPLQTAIKADAGKPLSNARLERAAALLDEIDRLGKELWTVMDGDNGNHSVTTPIGRVLLYVEEGLALNPETHITPGELAARLRALISSR